MQPSLFKAGVSKPRYVEILLKNALRFFFFLTRGPSSEVLTNFCQEKY